MVDRQVKIVLKGDISDLNRKLLEAGAGVKGFSRELDTSSDRMTNLTQSVLAFGPALIPVGAAAVPAVAGLANELGFAAAGAGVAALAFHGIGKALDVVNTYQLEPTTTNLEKMHQTLATLGPAGQDFVLFLQKARPELAHLQSLAQTGLFPGLEKGLSSLSGLMPDVQRIVTTISTTLGELSTEAGANLDSPKWHEFFDFLDREARPTLLEMGRAAGNLAEGFANLWMAFSPLSNNFSASFLGLARDFTKWTDGLDQTRGFQEFVDYINKEGPQAWGTLGALANAILQIVEAAAPVGAVTLPIFRELADAVGTLANTPLGPWLIGAAAALSLYTRAAVLAKQANAGVLGSLVGKSALSGTLAAVKDLPAASRAYLTLGSSIQNAGYSLGQFSATSERLRTSLKGTAKVAGGAGGLAFVMSGLDDKMGLTNTSTLALAGSLFGPWGAAVGGGIGLTKDLASANDDLWLAVSHANTVLGDSSSSLQDQAAAVDAARKKVDDLNASLNPQGISGALKLFEPQNLIKYDKNKIEGIFGKSDIAEANDALKGLEAQQQKNIGKAQDQQFAEAGLSVAMYGTSQATRDQTSAILKLIDARNTEADNLLAATDKQVAYEQAIDAATEAAKKNGRTVKDNGTELDINTAAGQNNQLALDRLAESWNNLDPAAQNAKGAFERARAEFVKVAERMGLNGVAARKYAADLLHTPTDITTDVRLLGTPAAIREAQALTRALRKIPHLTTATIRTIEETFVVPKKSDPHLTLKQMLTGNYAAGGFMPHMGKAGAAR